MPVAEFTDEHVSSRAYGLAPMQTGMLFQALLAAEMSGAGFDIEQIHIVVDEAISLREFRQAWTAVVRRHQALTSTFHWESVREPQQRTNPDATVPVSFEDWTELDEAERARRRDAFLARDRARGFDLRRGPLTRVAVFRCGASRSEIVWTIHHIVIDGRSMAPVLADVFTAYERLLRGEAVRLGPAPRPFRDSVEWLADRDRNASLQFFKELLRGKTAPTPLPLAEPVARPLPLDGVSTVVRRVDESVRSAAHALVGRRPQTSMGQIVQSAWALVLSRLTGELDVQFGTVRACRAGTLEGEARETVGLLMNTLPVRLRLDEDGLVGELLDQVRGHSMALRAHELTPLVEVEAQSELPPGTHLFETLLMFENRELNQELRGIDSRWRSRFCTLHEQPSLPLTVTVFDGDVLEVRVLFARARYREAVVERIAAYLSAAIEGLVRAGEHGRLGDVDIVPADERRRILCDWNDTARPYPDALRIHELFEQQVARRPGAAAIECRGATLTYAELEARANRLSHALIGRGAGPGVYIGVCLSRGFDLVVSLLAIAKSGAAYVPLDPEYPADRLAFMLADAGAPLVIVERRYRGLFEVAALVLDDGDGDEATIAAMPPTRPQCRSCPTDVCYAIYTSGSTGRPKGVVLTHRAVLNTFDWVNRTFGVGPGDRLLFVTSPSFDLSVYDVFGALGAGATVIVATSEWLADPEALARALVEEGITVWDSAPAALQRIVPLLPAPSARGGKAARLRLVMLSGDWIPIGLPGAIKDAFPGVDVRSLGGATEAAIWSNAFPIGDLDPRWTSIPYGRPIQNARYHVLDARLRPVAIGVAGDLYIGGACLAQGYLGRPDLTSERFIPDPFGAAGERLYKTGDLARYFDDGNLEFLGRADFQVKIRGFRVELGEIENELASLPDVREARCTAYADASGQKALAAFVVMRNDASFDEEAIKARLAKKLPAFMIPSQIALLSAMPMSSNGKVDCSALLHVAPVATRARKTAVAPRNDGERRLAAIWRDLLHRDEIGTDDNFFALGGHSLLAVMLVSRIATEFGVTLPLASVLEHPTLERLAVSLGGGEARTSRPRHLVTLKRGSRPPLVLVSGIGGMGFVFQGLARSLDEDQPLHVVNAIGTQDPTEGFDHTIERMAEIYEPQILDACPRGPIVLGGYSFGVLVAFELARRLRLQGRVVPLLVSLDGFAPGFPKLMPARARLESHLRAFLDPSIEARRAYLRGRIARLRERFYGLVGLPEKAVALPGVADVEIDRRLRKVTAGLMRARNLYRPARPDPANLLLIKTEKFEKWIGNKMDDPMYGWRSWVTGDIDVSAVPGAHLTMFHDANDARLAEIIAKAIDRAIPSSGPRESGTQRGGARC